MQPLLLGPGPAGTGDQEAGPKSQAAEGDQNGSAFLRCAGPLRAWRESTPAPASWGQNTPSPQDAGDGECALCTKCESRSILLAFAPGLWLWSACSFEPPCAFGLKWGAPPPALNWAGGAVVVPSCCCAHEAAVSSGLCLPSLAFPVLKPSHVPCRCSQGHKTQGVQEAQCPGECWFGVEWGLWEEAEARLKDPRTGSLARAGKKCPCAKGRQTHPAQRQVNTGLCVQ